MQDKTPRDAGHEPASRHAVTSPEPQQAGAGTLWLFTLTTFLSALLLFAIQPMFAKMVLPVLGGSPSVWAVAMLFFQAALLAGYCYAHLLLRFLPAETTGFVHLAVCALAFVALPIGLPAWFGEPPPGEPYLWQLGLFAVAVGLPFFAVSANAPLLQAWFATTGHRQSGDPYFLYAASNLGSFLALLGYPLVMEPLVGARALSWYWTVGFAALVAAIAVSYLVVRVSGGRATVRVAPRTADVSAAHPSWPDRLRWIGLALVPSALLTAFTNHVSTDVASAPLIWVMPLALYLLTFVLVFRQEPRVLLAIAVILGFAIAAVVRFVGDRLLGGTWEAAWEALRETYGGTRTDVFVGGMAGLLFLVVQQWLPARPMAWLRGIHLAAVVVALFMLSQTRFENWFISSTIGVTVFFAATLVAHRTLYESRPAPRHLTEFYLWMSLGGALGGLFAALIAPKIFSEVFEYPILVALTMACRPRALEGFVDGFRALWRWLAAAFARARARIGAVDQARIDELMLLWIVLSAGALSLLLAERTMTWLRVLDVEAVPGFLWWIGFPLRGAKKLGIWAVEWGNAAIVAGIFGLILLAAWRWPSRQLAAAMVMCAAVVLLPSGVRRSEAERSYFGVYRVYQAGNYNILMHGTTLHGAQKIRDDDGNAISDPTPATYYHPSSPMARSIEIARQHVTGTGGTARFGVVGLGSGSLACHASEGERWRFFEIDPVMVGIATNPENFSFLTHCQPDPPDVVIGDARLTLAREPDASFDILIIDAFSSDAVPIHLMTAEALKLYLDKVGPSGIAVLHVSNRYLDLDGVLAATARLVPGAKGLVVSDDMADGGYGSTSSTIVVFSMSDASLAPFRELGDVSELDNRARSIVEPNCADQPGFEARLGCHALRALRAAGLAPSTSGLRPWTDDFSDILGPFITKMRGSE